MRTGAYPDFPLALLATTTYVSVELTTGFGHPLFRSHQLCPGAPRSDQRTWVKQDGAKPHQSSAFSLFRHHQRSGAPHLARFSRDVGYHCSAPEALSPQILLIPPFAKNAKDGPPDHLVLTDGCFFSKSRMQCINATSLNGKSRAAQWRGLRFLFAGFSGCNMEVP